MADSERRKSSSPLIKPTLLHSSPSNPFSVLQDKNEINFNFTAKELRESEGLSPRTQLICTITPDCENALDDLLDHGMSLVNLNMTRYPASETEYVKLLRLLRKDSKKFDRAVCVCVDLKGPNIFLGPLSSSRRFFTSGETVPVRFNTIVGDDSHSLVFLGENISSIIENDTVVTLDGGHVNAVTKNVTDGGCSLHITKSGTVQQNTMIVVPETSTIPPLLSEDDMKSLRFVVDYDCDAVMVHARSGDDIVALKEVLSKLQKDRHKEERSISIVAKIECKLGLQNLDEIMAATDVVMINREALGAVIPVQKVCMVQKYIIQTCNKQAKPVITAYQILNSMVNNPDAHRAECTDIANAIFDGTDSLILHEPIAEGHYRVEALDVLKRICVSSEKAYDYKSHFRNRLSYIKQQDRSEAIASSAVKTSIDLQVPLVVVLSSTGLTARLVAKYRPNAPIMCITEYETIRRQCLFTRGVVGYIREPGDADSYAIKRALDWAVSLDWVKIGEDVVAVSGQNHVSGSSNTIQVITIGGKNASLTNLNTYDAHDDKPDWDAVFRASNTGIGMMKSSHG